MDYISALKSVQATLKSEWEKLGAVLDMLGG